MMLKQIGGILGLFLLVGALVFVAPITTDSDGTVTIGLGEVSAAPTATTKITSIKGIGPVETGSTELFVITANAQTKTLEEDEILAGIQVTVFLDDAYAASTADAQDNVRFVVTLVNPASSTVYSRTIDEDWSSVKTWTAVDMGGYYAVYTWWNIDDALYDNITLTAGNWTLSVNYEIYA